jgi:hypothetical protein
MKDVGVEEVERIAEQLISDPVETPHREQRIPEVGDAPQVYDLLEHHRAHQGREETNDQEMRDQRRRAGDSLILGRGDGLRRDQPLPDRRPANPGVANRQNQHRDEQDATGRRGREAGASNPYRETTGDRDGDRRYGEQQRRSVGETRKGR